MRPLLVMVGLLFASALRGAGLPEISPARGWLHLNGYTHHFDAPNANDNLFGLGLTWQRPRSGRLLRAWETDVFRDSGRELSAYVGHSWVLPYRHARVGVTGALMYHRNFAKQNPLRVLPVALPFCELGGRALRLRVYYIPPVRHRRDHQVSFQLLTPVWR